MLGLLACGLLATGLPAGAGAVEPLTVSMEIEELLQDLGNSGCEFYRNGEWFDARRAEAHLRNKLQLMRAGGRVRSTEDFIDQLATRSSLSGREYQVRCAGAAPQSSNKWLKSRLTRRRECIAHGNPCTASAAQGSKAPDLPRQVSRLSAP